MKIDFSTQPNATDRSVEALLDDAQLICRQLSYDVLAIRIATPLDVRIARSKIWMLQSPCVYMAVAASLRARDCIKTAVHDLTDPVAAGKLGFSLYVGLPLRLPSGKDAGTLAVLARKPRPLRVNELHSLKVIRDSIIQFVELRTSVTEAA